MSGARDATLEAFATLSKLPTVARIVQRGRDHETARFTFHFADGRQVRVGTIDTLWSRTRLSKVLAVAIQKTVAPCRPEDWSNTVAALVSHVVEVEETPGETFDDSVRAWALRYGHSATTDRDGAARRGDPFRDGDQLHLTADGLARYIRREYSEQIRLTELRTALRDLGFERRSVSYDRVRGRRSSTGYYRIEIAELETERE